MLTSLVNEDDDMVSDVITHSTQRTALAPACTPTAPAAAAAPTALDPAAPALDIFPVGCACESGRARIVTSELSQPRSARTSHVFHTRAVTFAIATR